MASLVADSLWVREPNLLVPGGKPAGPMILDRSANVVPDYLLIPGLPNQPSQRAFDMVKQKEGEPWDSDVVIEPSTHGMSVNTPDNSSWGNGLLLPIISSDTSHTLELFMLWNGDSVYMFDAQVGRFIIGTEVGNYAIYDGAWKQFSLATPSSLSLEHLIVTANADATSCKLFSRRNNSQIKAESVTYTPKSIGGTTRLFSRYFAGATQSLQFANLYLFAFYDRALTDAEAASRLTDPYQFLIPA